jgi:hypothetical protein
MFRKKKLASDQSITDHLFQVCDGPVLDLEVAFSCGDAIGSVYLDERVVARTEAAAVGAVAAANLPLEIVYVVGSNDHAMMFKNIK